MPIYTRTGDKGETGVLNGKRLKKYDKLIEALGSIDELNAILGTIESTKFLKIIQNDLFTIGSILAGPPLKVPDRILEFENEIDKMTAKLPKLQNFILPQGQIHLARAVCRRAERRLVDSGRGQNDTIKYLNRLGDYLFTLARFKNYKEGKKEIIWKVTS